MGKYFNETMSSKEARQKLFSIAAEHDKAKYEDAMREYEDIRPLIYMREVSSPSSYLTS
jgi:hypothetical protein